MPNSLYRDARVVSTPAVAARAYQPAYTTYITREVQLAPQAGASGGGYGRWAYEYVTDPDTFVTTRNLVYLPDTPTNNAAVSAATVGGMATIVTPVYHPAVQAIAGSSGRIEEIPPRGWTAFAHSALDFPGSASMTFSVPANVVGVAVGFASTSAPVPSAGYGHIRDGLLFTDNKVALLRNGTFLGDYLPGDVINITRKRSGTVTVSINAGEVDSRASQDSAAALIGSTHMAVAMYAVGDALNDPAFLGLNEGEAAWSCLPW